MMIRRFVVVVKLLLLLLLSRRSECRVFCDTMSLVLLFAALHCAAESVYISATAAAAALEEATSYGSRSRRHEIGVSLVDIVLILAYFHIAVIRVFLVPV